MVIATGGGLDRAASPSKAVITKLIETAASASLRTGVIIVTNCRGFYWRWGGGTGLRRVHTILGGVRRLNSNSTLASACTSQITLQSDVATLSPSGTP